MTEQKHEVVTRADLVPARTVLHPVVAEMLKQNPTPETARELLTLQREWEAGEAKRAYTAALVGLRQDLPPWIKHDKTVRYDSSKGGQVHYTHTSLAAAMEAVLPALTAHGFSLSWIPATEPNKVTVTARLTHREGHSEPCTISAPPDTSGSKSPAQAVASTITLLERYSALALLGIATADMGEDRDEPPPANGDIDTARNIRAVAALAKAGKAKDAAEEYVGRPAAEWTSADLDKLRAWIKAGPEREEAK